MHHSRSRAGGWRTVRARVVLAAAMAAFTVATGLAFNEASLTLARFFFGVGAAAAFQAASRGLVRWLPASSSAGRDPSDHETLRPYPPPPVSGILYYVQH